MIGYATPQAMVKAFMEDEEKHLEGIVAFLVAAGIDDDLRAHRWDVAARVYNGPGYAKHNYHGRMAAAFRKWAGIRDTPWSPDTVTSPRPDPADQAPTPQPKPPTATPSAPQPPNPPTPKRGFWSRVWSWIIGD